MPTDTPMPWIAGGLAALLLAIVVVVVVSITGSAPPASSKPSSASRSLAPYWIVRRGDTYGEIAQKTGLSIAQLESFNPFQDPDAIRPGQRIKLRLHIPAPRKRLGPRRWTVRRGDTFASIARKTGHNIDALRARNPQLDPDALQPGQRIRLRR